MSRLQKDKGIVVRSFKYGESSVILDILTENNGLKSFIIQSVRKAKSRTSPSSIQLMAAVDLDYYVKENAELFQLKELKINKIWLSLYSDMRKIAVCMYLAELTRKILNKYENHPEEYSLLLEVLEDLEEYDDNWIVHIWYTLKIKTASGFSLLRHSPGPGRYFDIRYDGETAFRPAHPYYLEQQDIDILNMLNHLEVRQVSSMHLPRNERNRLLDLLLEYLRIHISGFQTLQSLAVLKTVFE